MDNILITFYILCGVLLIIGLIRKLILSVSKKKKQNIDTFWKEPPLPITPSPNKQSVDLSRTRSTKATLKTRSRPTR